MTFIRRNQNTKGGNYAKGKNAVAIDQRTGFKHLQSDMVFEPGTGYYVHKSESDGGANLVSDPLNYGPKFKPESIGLKYTSPDVALSIGTIVSATSFGSTTGSFTFYNYPTSAMTTET
jgi:hypothetical protein